MYEIAIIGAGAAGIEAAKLASKHRLRAILIDKGFDDFGGVCLNKGCIPAKYYLNLSRHNRDLHSIYNDKNSIVKKIKDPTLDFLKGEGVDILWGQARFADKNTIAIGDKRIEARNIIIATGSLPQEIIKTDNKKVICCDDIFSFSELPSKFLIVGAGVVGLEMACLLRNLDKEVLVIEKEDRILPKFDRALAERLKPILDRKDIKIKLSDDINNYDIEQFDMVVLATGRRPNLDELGCDSIGLAKNNEGWLDVDDTLKTNISSIWACGDTTGRKLLAYVATNQARICINNIVGNKKTEDYKGLAECVFTQPQIAFAGILKDEAEERGIECNVIKSNFFKFSSAYVYSDTNGFIQILVDSDGIIIGAGIISNIASELISIFSLAIRLELKISQLRELSFIHPTISEIIADVLKS